MRALVFSDSHGRLKNAISVIEMNRNHADYILHLGDVERDLDDLRCCYPEFKIEGVNGNNDWNPHGVFDLILTIGGHRVMMTHGHRYGVKSGDSRLIERAKAEGVDVLLYGHTHQPVCRNENGILILNPGSISLPASGRPTFGTLDFLSDTVVGKITEV